MITTSSSDKATTDTRFWDERRNVIRSRIGGARIGEGTVTSHGYSLLEDLAGKKSFFQILILNVTGRLSEERLARWMEASFICLSWPDSRIWCNGIGSLAGTMRASPVAAVTAGVLASDSRIYGPPTAKMAATAIAEGVALQRQGQTLKEIVGQINRVPQKRVPVIPGFSRPVATGDERVPVMHRVAEELGFGIEDHLAFAYDVHEFLLSEHGESINLAGYVAAFLTDQGVTPGDIYRLYSMCVNSGVHACYGEAYDNPAESYLPMRCDDVEYVGVPYRSVPQGDGG